MCDKCKRIKDSSKDVFAWMRTQEPGTQNEFILVTDVNFCPVCGGKFDYPRNMICSAIDEDKRGGDKK